MAGVHKSGGSSTASYREEMDVFGGFIDDACVAQAGILITAKELYEAYAAWCEANGDRPRSQKALSRGLLERGFETAKGTKGVRCWRGVRLRREGEATATPAEAGGGWRMGGATSAYSSHVPQGSHGAYAGCDPSSLRVKYPEHAPPSATRHPAEASADDEEGEL